jgi:hypothetical protein
MYKTKIINNKKGNIINLNNKSLTIIIIINKLITSIIIILYQNNKIIFKNIKTLKINNNKDNHIKMEVHAKYFSNHYQI